MATEGIQGPRWKYKRVVKAMETWRQEYGSLMRHPVQVWQGTSFEITTLQHISTRLNWIHQSTPPIEQPLIRGTDSIYGIPIYLFSRIHRKSILKIVDRLTLSLSLCYLYFMYTYISDGGVGGYVGCMYKSHFFPNSYNFSHFSCCLWPD